MDEPRGAIRYNRRDAGERGEPLKLSAIVACYNAAGTLGMQIEAIAAQSWRGQWEVVVVDNRSTDNSVRIACEYQRKMPRLRIVEAREKQGPAHV
jgi:glycosyltransferase involved in cell wall biosynthesis